MTETDVATNWKTLKSVWNKGAEGVCREIAEFIAAPPFEVLMRNSDNGGECINGHIKRHFAEYLPGGVRTRSHSHRKNDKRFSFDATG